MSVHFSPNRFSLRFSVYPLAVCGMLLVAGPLYAQQPAGPADPAAPAASQPVQAAPAPAASQPGQMPDATTGMATPDQPVNNANPNVAGEILPSSQRTAAHDETIFEHDKEPIAARTFNFNDEQKQAILSAIAAEKGDAQMLQSGAPLTESMVIPADAEVKPLPDAISAQMPWTERYGYVRDGERILLIDPHLRYVAAIIETSTSGR